MNKIKLAREIAKRSEPRFIDIEPLRTGTAYRNLIKKEPKVDVKRQKALAKKAEEEKRVSRKQNS